MTNLTTVEIDQLARRIVELGGSAGVTQRCVPLASGGLNPDSRVNYEFGLVLGVEEFRQEQFYHLQKSYLHNRALHGYGVVSGLEVEWERAGDDIRVTVGEGVGVDQCGRTFLIRSAQCANLRAWLERNRSVDLAAGPLSLYVVGTYDECADALVAIAGQPCASSEQSLAASRIRDSFNITLRARPPAMPGWDAIGRLAALMARVRIVDGLPAADSDEAAISARVRVIDNPAALAALDPPAEGAGPPAVWRLPAEGINETLDRIFMLWVTEVRPRVTPTVIGGCGTTDPVETGILLARLNLYVVDAGAITFDFDAQMPIVSHDGRSYLLQTQLIQELLFLGVGGAGDVRMREVRDFAVPSRRTADDVPRIRLWFPFDGPVDLDAAREDGPLVRVHDSASGQDLGFSIQPGDNNHVWWLVPVLPTGKGRAAALRQIVETLNNGLLTIWFNAAAINVDDDSGPQLLPTVMAQGHYSYIGYDGLTIVVPYAPDPPPAPVAGGLTETEVVRLIQQNRQPLPPTIPLADLQFISITTEQQAAQAAFELWFHADLKWPNYQALVADGFSMQVFAEVLTKGQPMLVPLHFTTARLEGRPNVFTVNVDSDGGSDRLQYLRFVFPIGQPFGFTGEGATWRSLQEVMQAVGVRFESLYDVEQYTNEPAVVLYGRSLKR